MYGYNQYVPLNVEEILKRASEESIFKIVIQEDIVDINEDPGARYLAPYRDDTNPDCYFKKTNGVLRFIDFAKNIGRPGINCFEFIQKCYECSFTEALKIININLELGLGDNLGKAKKIIHEHGCVEEKNVNKVFKERVITFLPRQFNYKDKQFWSNYEISRENLMEDGVVPVDLYKSISRKGFPFSIRPIDICYAYTKFYDIEGNLLENKVKIYRPHASKDAKWFTNCNQNNIGSIETLDFNKERLVITKSYKDCRVLRNQGINSIWFQSESMIPNKEILLNICNQFSDIVIWFDNDNTGITNSRIICNYINLITNSSKCRFIILPPRLLKQGIKDPSDYLKNKGKEFLLNFLKRHNI